MGLAARFLSPKPRNFRAGKFRLVSTVNGVPTREDLSAVLVRGMNGSSMTPWLHLPVEDREALINEVLRLHRDGMREQYVSMLKQAKDLTDEEISQEDVQNEIRTFVKRRTTPGPSLMVPEIGKPTTESIARGKTIYLEHSCHSCHGNEGQGDGSKIQFDDEGFRTRPRDYTRGIFKGGYDTKSLYRRIAYGMPGTPMPASTKLTVEENITLVHFIRSLSDEETRSSALLRRQQIFVKHVAQTPGSADSKQWTEANSMRLQMIPLWWHDNANPKLVIQALHDKHTISVRLSWNDQTADRHAVTTTGFEDAVALELFQGDAEPFVGMGDGKSDVEMWYWDADRQNGAENLDIRYPRTVVDIYPFREEFADSAEFDRPATAPASQPRISLPALASGNRIVPTDRAAHPTLSANGPGTLSFRVPHSQLVKASGTWKDGKWTVVMTRTIAGEATSSHAVPLEPNTRASIAFAVWDGSKRDRDGKKLITIWHDLILEK
jgi:mono/diheme cytochrome c family protein